MSLQGKVAIVTGASSGIGEATAREFGRQGAKVVLAARRVEKLQELAREIDAMNSGAASLVVQADLSKLEDIQALVSQTTEKFGRIDILVNNAGFGRLDWLENLDPVKDIQINMCSMAGLVATPTYTIYAASKHAVHGFSEALRREVKPWGIDVSLIYPGGVVTEFASHAGIKRKTNAATPRFMLLTAEQVGQAVVKLVRRPRRMWIIPWLWSVTVFMNRFLPGLVDYTTINRFTIPEREDELNAK